MSKSLTRRNFTLALGAAAAAPVLATAAGAAADDLESRVLSAFRCFPADLRVTECYRMTKLAEIVGGSTNLVNRVGADGYRPGRAEAISALLGAIYPATSKARADGWGHALESLFVEMSHHDAKEADRVHGIMQQITLTTAEHKRERRTFDWEA